MRNEKLYLLLTDTGTLLNKIIKAYTKKPYNHASIAFDSELKEVYSFGRKTARNPFIGGFVREDMNSVLFKHANCAIYSLTVSGGQLRKIKHFIQEIEKHKEYYHYNFLGLFGVMLNKPIKRKHAYFCSQFVASVLKEGMVIDDMNEPSLIKPADLPYLADFQLIFEGNLQNYRNRCMTKTVPGSFSVISV